MPQLLSLAKYAFSSLYPPFSSLICVLRFIHLLKLQQVDWQKSQQLASKLVTIRTPFYVTNSTTIPIYLALHSPVTSYHYTSAAPIGISIPSSPSIANLFKEPGEKLYVPLAYAHPETRTSVSVCPVVDRLTMNWSEAPFPFDGFAPMVSLLSLLFYYKEDLILL